MLPTPISFAIGLSILLLCAQFFVNITQQLAARWRFSPLFISLVLVALGTNLPELTLTLAAIANQDTGLAMGNLIGSSILNITLVLGVSALFGKIRIGTTKTPKNASLLFIITLLFTSLQLSSLSAVTRASILLLLLTITMVYQYLLALNGRNHEDQKLIKMLNAIVKKNKTKPTWVYLAGLLASVAGVWLGGNISVTAIEAIAVQLRLSTTFLGLTLAAVSTSLPELLISVTASRKKDTQDSKLVIGTLMGSNIFNLTLFPAIVLLSTQTIGVTLVERVFLLLSTALLAIIIHTQKGKDISKKIGLVLIALFLIFILFVPRI